MAGCAMNKAICLLSAVVLATLSACSGQGSSGDQPPLAGARIGAPFTLTDQDGRKTSWDSFKGQYRLVYFGYTYCPDICPVDLQKIAQAFIRFEKQDPVRAAKVQPIFITVDPERDTVPVVKNYVRAFHPRLIGLTGTAEDIGKVARDFAVIASKEGAGKDYLVAHSRTPYLFGPDGAPIALIPVGEGPDGTADAILKTLDTWVK
ncbi:SCO family protein [Sphingobium algorifonticola]|uniref:SCO family protein n=1 Tax=Sphingobium algorifonticola TaxID=2008318 RepID=A0A437JDZ4_9SPHN|nr:SCO family protein [Sphingobium algorifonticola]RVT43832.1 SCO family protein [Sphingobium algorifonticola]